MKSNEEITSNLFKRRDEYVSKKKRKNKIIVSAVSLFLVVLLGLGVWQFDLFKTPPIDAPDDNVLSDLADQNSQDAHVPSDDNDPVQSEDVQSTPKPKPPSPIDQTTPSAQDIPTEIGGAEGWWYDAVYEFKYIEEGGSYIDLIVDKETSDSWYNRFWLINKETYTRVENVGIIGAVDELGITKEQFVTAVQEKGVIVDGRYYHNPFYVDHTPIDDRFEAFERYWYLTQEEVDLIFSSDKELRDEKCRSRYTAFANGKIYTPHWICSHTAEDYIAAGLTKQQLIETISTWNHVGTPIVVEDDGEVWSDRERFMTVIDFVKAEIDKMP